MTVLSARRRCSDATCVSAPSRVLQVDAMRDELLKLHPVDDSDRVSNASDRSDSSDSVDPKHLPSAFYDNPNDGKKRFQVRFKVKDYKPESIKMTVDKGRIRISAVKVEKRSNGADREVRYTKKFKKPTGVQPEQLTSKLTSDGILLIEAPMRPRHHTHRETYSKIPMEHTQLTFRNSQQKKMDSDQARLAHAVKEKKKQYEKEVNMMKEEFLMLFRADVHLDPCEPHPDPLVIQRVGSVDVMDKHKMRTLYHVNPETGLRSLRLRFNVRDFDMSSINIRIESEAVVVRAFKSEPCPDREGASQAVEYVRKVQVPADVDVARIRSNLTKDGILDVQIPVIASATDEDLKTPTNRTGSETDDITDGGDFFLGDDKSREADVDEGSDTDTEGDVLKTPVNREIPLSFDAMTFSGIHEDIADKMVGRLNHDVQKKRIQWEIDIKVMHQEFLKLYPADKDWGSDDFLQDPFIRKRIGSMDVLNTDEMKSLYQHEESGRVVFRLRFDVREFERSSLTVVRESDRVAVTAQPREGSGSGDDAVDSTEARPTYTRKIRFPWDVDVSNIKSFLTKDGILIVEAPSTRKAKEGSGSTASSKKVTPHASPMHTSTSMQMPTSMQTSIHSSQSAYSIGSDKSSKVNLPKPNMPMFNKINGVKHLLLVVQIGTDFDPRDITVQANSASCLNVKAKHTEVTQERYSKHKFHRDYELPEKIETTSLRAGVRTDGLLIIAALAKGENMMGHSISLKSLYLNNAEACHTESE